MKTVSSLHRNQSSLQWVSHFRFVFQRAKESQGFVAVSPLLALLHLHLKPKNGFLEVEKMLGQAGEVSRGTEASRSVLRTHFSQHTARVSKVAARLSGGRKQGFFFPHYYCLKRQFLSSVHSTCCSLKSIFQPTYSAQAKRRESNVLALGNEFPGRVSLLSFFRNTSVFYYQALYGFLISVVILLRKISLKKKLVEKSQEVKRHCILSQWLCLMLTNGWERTATNILTNQTSFSKIKHQSLS